MSFTDAAQLYIRAVGNLKKGTTSIRSPLEEFVIRECGKDLAYVDNRRDARQMYDFDFWAGFSLDWLRRQKIEKRLLYSQSQQFPDFLFKVKRRDGKYVGGSLVELKDSKGGNVASFNSTIPTRCKSLEEIDVINGNRLVSRIAAVMDGKLAADRLYFKFERRCFYILRTHKESRKAKVSIVDGSFFETVPKEHLFYQMLLGVLRAHLEEKRMQVSPETLEKVEEALSHVTDQTIIAKSQIIEGASVRPRLRVMAEVHQEGNPHSGFYPEISEGSFNLILQSSPEVNEVRKELSAQIPKIVVFSIRHKRNGEHTVFQYKEDRD